MTPPVGTFVTFRPRRYKWARQGAITKHTARGAVVEGVNGARWYTRDRALLVVPDRDLLCDGLALVRRIRAEGRR